MNPGYRAVVCMLMAAAWLAQGCETGRTSPSAQPPALVAADAEQPSPRAEPRNAPATRRATATRPATRPRREPLVIPDVPRDQLVCFCLYTVHNKTLKLSAQLYPLKEGEARTVALEIEREGGTWEKIAEQDINPQGMIATFRIEKWDDSKRHHYRVTHPGGTKYDGIIRANPTDKDEIVVGNLSCNSNTDRGPRADIVANLKAQDPDLLFFAGDQSYDHKEHYAAWLLFGRQFGEIIKDRPTVTIPDDHDVGHPNIWGEAGGISTHSGNADGGYVMPVEYVNEVQRCQTAHLPDPYDPTPVRRGITVYYTSLNVGGIDFAILEDRKWKSGPLGLVDVKGPRPDHVKEPPFDPATIDVPEAELLGERQLKFLREWATQWGGAQMKVVLSQTPFAGAAHLHGQINNRLLADLDSNGWPQTGRNKALIEMRKAFAFHMAGDQHLSTAMQYGVNEFDDSGWVFVSPSIWNLYSRWWWPLEKPAGGALEGNPLEFAGRHHDGFGNKLTMHAYANPNPTNHAGTGYGLVRLKKSTRQITMECWPRFVDVTKPDAKQYEGWPITITQEANYGRKAAAWLPKLNIAGQEDALVQVVDESDGSIVYTLRINGTTWRPKVFRDGTYTIHVGEGEKRKTFKGVEAVTEADGKTLGVSME